MVEAKYFSRKELECRCGCGLVAMSSELLMKLDSAREEYGHPIVVTSGMRCPDHNKAVGGVSTSAHVTGEAVDVKIYSSSHLFHILRLGFRYFDRIGISRDFVHFDVSTTLPTPRVWTY